MGISRRRPYDSVLDIGMPLFIFLPERHYVLAFSGQDWQLGLEVLGRLRA